MRPNFSAVTQRMQQIYKALSNGQPVDLSEVSHTHSVLGCRMRGWLQGELIRSIWDEGRTALHIQHCGLCALHVRVSRAERVLNRWASRRVLHLNVTQ
jgi:hypothetical protein